MTASPPLNLVHHGGVPRRPVHTLFVDENGHGALRRLDVVDNRFFGLTGVACAISHARGVIEPEMTDLKLRHFGTENVVLHCEDIKHRKKHFEVFRDAAARHRFDREVLAAFARWHFTVFSVLLDKQELMDRYGHTRYDPYHYALEVLVEGYVRWLEEQESCGNVTIEARGGREDRALDEAFNRLWEDGTEYLDAARVQTRLTSRRIKIQIKSENVAGLQLADLIAHPSFTSMRMRVLQLPMKSLFGSRVVEILEASRYYRVDGCIDGCGRKWLP